MKKIVQIALFWFAIIVIAISFPHTHVTIAWQLPEKNVYQEDCIDKNRLFTIRGASMAISLDNQYLVTEWEELTSRIWDLKTGKVIHTITTDIHRAVFSPDSLYLATGDHGGTTILWEVVSGRELHRFTSKVKSPFSYNPVRSIIFSPDGHYLLTGDASGANLWDVQTGVEVQYFPSEIDRAKHVDRAHFNLLQKRSKLQEEGQ
jgi:WD40 repeat protein